jgi:hypothetical protein
VQLFVNKVRNVLFCTFLTIEIRVVFKRLPICTKKAATYKQKEANTKFGLSKSKRKPLWGFRSALIIV